MPPKAAPRPKTSQTSSDLLERILEALGRSADPLVATWAQKLANGERAEGTITADGKVRMKC